MAAALNSRTIEIADETGRVVDVVNVNDVLFKAGQFRSLSDPMSPNRRR